MKLKNDGRELESRLPESERHIRMCQIESLKKRGHGQRRMPVTRRTNASRCRTIELHIRSILEACAPANLVKRTEDSLGAVLRQDG